MRMMQGAPTYKADASRKGTSTGQPSGKRGLHTRNRTRRHAAHHLAILTKVALCDGVPQSNERGTRYRCKATQCNDTIRHGAKAVCGDTRASEATNTAGEDGGVERALSERTHGWRRAVAPWQSRGGRRRRTGDRAHSWITTKLVPSIVTVRFGLSTRGMLTSEAKFGPVMPRVVGLVLCE